MESCLFRRLVTLFHHLVISLGTGSLFVPGPSNVVRPWGQEPSLFDPTSPPILRHGVTPEPGGGRRAVLICALNALNGRIESGLRRRNLPANQRNGNVRGIDGGREQAVGPREGATKARRWVDSEDRSSAKGMSGCDLGGTLGYGVYKESRKTQ